MEVVTASDLTESAAEAVEQPQGDILAILLEQHARIRELLHPREGC
jgi:hypothetical protein